MANRSGRRIWNGEFSMALGGAGYNSVTETPVFNGVSSAEDVRLQVEDALMNMWESGMSPEEAVMELEDEFFSEKWNIDLGGASEEEVGYDEDQQHRDRGTISTYLGREDKPGSCKLR